MKSIYALAGLALVLHFACTGGPTPNPADKGAEFSMDSIHTRGRAIAKASFEALSGQLTKAMAEGGVAHALSFCHENAYPITDSLSATYRVRIRRVAERCRNPQNSPDAREQEIFEQFKALKAKGYDLKKIDTAVVLASGRVLFAKPILVQPQCMVCHGTVGESVAETDYREILRLYPGDRAVGFSAGDLRGMWAIYFEGIDALRVSKEDSKDKSK